MPKPLTIHHLTGDQEAFRGQFLPLDQFHRAPARPDYGHQSVATLKDSSRLPIHRTTSRADMFKGEMSSKSPRSFTDPVRHQGEERSRLGEEVEVRPRIHSDEACCCQGYFEPAPLRSRVAAHPRHGYICRRGLRGRGHDSIRSFATPSPRDPGTYGDGLRFLRS